MDTPVPIPNTEVKHACADGTVLATGWKSRSLPILLITLFYSIHQIPERKLCRTNFRKNYFFDSISENCNVIE